MNTKTSEQKKLMTFGVWSLDVWGHSHDDCHNYECPCVSTDPEDPESYDNPPECMCGYEVNDRFRAGKITIEVVGTIYNVGVVWDCRECKGAGYVRVNGVDREDCMTCKKTGKVSAEFTSFTPSDEQLISALRDSELLKVNATLNNVEFESSDGEFYEVNEKKDGRPVFQLELESTVEEGGVS